MSTSRGPKIPIGKILLEQGVITADQLKQALAVQKTKSEKLGRILIELGFVSERQVLTAYAQQLSIPLYDPTVAPDPSVAKVIPDHLVQRYNVVPLRRDGNKLVVAMLDPSNVFALDDLRLVTGFDIDPVLATPDDMDALRSNQGAAPASESSMTTALAVATGAEGDGQEGAADFNTMVEAIRRPDVPGQADDDGTMDVTEDAPVIRMVNVLIQNAIKEGASDIHVEPDRKHVRIRYRIDGVLYEMMSLPKFAHAPLISRLKIMADMNIAERRIPQDGRIHIRFDKRDYDMRVNMLPTVFGEKCVMRILDQSVVLIGLGRLGFTAEMMAELEELIIKPNGMVLATGPTGSGKTTTLYSILNRINSIEKNILTVEDPVEYQLPGVNQVSVNRKSGLTFPVAMRAFLRQDPDIIMVGEIRDLETAEIAVQASLTGHLVLSTLHTNDSPSTIVRLSDMGIEPFLISASIIGVIAQRLGRKLCERCKAPVVLPPDAMKRMGMTEAQMEAATFFKPVGCSECSNRGFRGRIGIYELLTLNEELGELIVRRAPLSEITQAALAGGMTSLVMDGMIKAQRGITTVEEVLRVVSTH
ncbi:MAG: Type II secretion system protein E [bacterium ADurb.Bin429]|nr:MAG: Type II secretion system protein E [bacterium ADurb.Bin429]